MNRREGEGERRGEARGARGRSIGSAGVAARVDRASEAGVAPTERAVPSHEDPGFLAYLDALLTAVLARASREILVLLEHPLARGLSRDAREEAVLAARAPASLRAPVRLLRFHYRMSQLLTGDDSVEELEPSGARRSWFGAESDEEEHRRSSEADAAPRPQPPDPNQLEMFPSRRSRRTRAH